MPTTFLLALALSASGPDPALIRSSGSGPWSSGVTWEGGAVPGAGARVQVRGGHAVTYDVASDSAIRSIHVAGTLEFARDRDTRLTVGLIKVQPGDDASENGFGCDAHATADTHPAGPRPSLLVGLPGEPVPSGKSMIPSTSRDRIRVQGSAIDDGEIRKVVVNGRGATAIRANFAEWAVEFDLDGSEALKVTAFAEDAAGNLEKTPHVVRWSTTSGKVASAGDH